MQPHRSSALDGAAAVLTVALRRGVAVPLSWSWSHHPQGRALAAASAHVDTKGRTPYGGRFLRIGIRLFFFTNLPGTPHPHVSCDSLTG